MNGRHYQMEMHLVHISKDQKLAVIGVFIEEGGHNETFDTIWSNFPLETGQEVHPGRQQPAGPAQGRNFSGPVAA